MSKHIDFIIADAICLEVSFIIACQLRQEIFPGLLPRYTMFAILILILFFAIVLFWNIYSGILRRNSLMELKIVTAMNSGIFLLLNVLMFITKSTEDYSRAILISFFVLSTVIMQAVHTLMKHFIIKKRKNLGEQMVLVSKAGDVEEFCKHLVDNDETGIVLVGLVLCDESENKEICGLPVLCNLSELNGYLIQNKIKNVLLNVNDEDMDDLIEDLILDGNIVYRTLRSLRKSSFRYRIEHFKGYTSLSIREQEISAGQLLLKRAADVFFSLLCLIISSPVMAVAAILVKKEDGGPVFYASRRVGYHGKEINVYKFRSMKLNADKLEDMLTAEELAKYYKEYKLDNDPRVTKIGNILRKTSIDELPQLINILKGDMSFVGPRPVTYDETLLYGKSRKLLLSLKPGLTGYWQARGRNNVTYESGKRQEMELYYAEHFSVILDFKILIWTVKAVLTGDGAK